MNRIGWLTLICKPLAVLAAVLLPSATSLACAVCGAGQEESRLAFIWTTGLLSSVPLLSIAGVAGFLYNRAQRDESED